MFKLIRHFFIVASILFVLPTLAETMPSPPLKQVLFNHVNIFDGKTNKLWKNRYVLVEGNIIKAVSKTPPWSRFWGTLYL